MEYKGQSRDKAIFTSLDIIRAPHAWPGGYEKVAITDDGGALCHQCVKDNLRIIATSYKGDGWHVIDSDIVDFSDETLYCDHCGRVIYEKEN